MQFAIWYYLLPFRLLYLYSFSPLSRFSFCFPPPLSLRSFPKLEVGASIEIGLQSSVHTYQKIRGNFHVDLLNKTTTSELIS